MGMRAAAAKIVPPLALILVPAITFAVMFRVSYASGSMAIDFHTEIYPEAKELLKGQNPFPAPTADLSQASNHIWPPLAGYLAAPLTVFSPNVADIIIVFVGIACFGAALWTVGVRDWRVYGASVLWAPVISEVKTAHLSLILCLFVAVVWQSRERTAIPGITLGVAIGLKFFLWPLILWLAALRRWREAGIAAATAAGSLLLVLPFIGIFEYARLLRRLGSAFDYFSFTPYGILAQAGAPGIWSRVAALTVGVTCLAVAWRRRSFALSIAAALLLSPIVWFDYFAITAIPLAVVRPRFSWIWLLPILTWGVSLPGTGIGVLTQGVRVLAIFGVIVWYTERRENETLASRTNELPRGSGPGTGRQVPIKA